MEKIKEEGLVEQPTDGEMKVQLTTSSEGHSAITTTTIKGKLDCMIIETNKPVDILIESSLGYTIYKELQVEGVHYISPRNTISIVDGDPRDILTFDKFNLNESIKIDVSAQDAIVDITLRW